MSHSCLIDNNRLWYISKVSLSERAVYVFQIQQLTSFAIVFSISKVVVCLPGKAWTCIIPSTFSWLVVNNFLNLFIFFFRTEVNLILEAWLETTNQNASFEIKGQSARTICVFHMAANVSLFTFFNQNYFC